MALACGEGPGPTCSPCDRAEFHCSPRQVPRPSELGLPIWGLAPGAWGWLHGNQEDTQQGICSEGQRALSGAVDSHWPFSEAAFWAESGGQSSAGILLAVAQMTSEGQRKLLMVWWEIVMLTVGSLGNPARLRRRRGVCSGLACWLHLPIILTQVPPDVAHGAACHEKMPTLPRRL